jgi:hypothetical protein
MPLPARVTVLAVLAVLALVLVPSAMASHQFSDVPNDHPFHTEIGVFRDTNITSGCTAFEFCPQDVVRRQAMAAFVTRALGLAVRPNETGLRAVPGSKIATIDDGSSLVGTFNGALEFSHNGVRVLRLETVSGRANVIGGFGGNNVTAGVFGATVSGGGESGGVNRVTDRWGTVGGGWSNRAGDDAGTTVDRAYATVSGGGNNTASGSLATVGGGATNTAGGQSATVGGGSLNVAGGFAATVPGGYSNTAGGSYSFAAGNQAKANHAGSFVWADSHPFDRPSTAVNSFVVRATGGAHFVSGIDLGTGASTSGVSLSAGAGAWTSLSDVNAKTRFAPVDKQELLRRLAALPIRSWSYKSQDRSIRHLGPTAQDFKRAFGLGESATGITTIDADGVALAAIQALHAENQALRRQSAALMRRHAAQDARLAALERTVAELTKKR